jgi:hypothetical protein
VGSTTGLIRVRSATSTVRTPTASEARSSSESCIPQKWRLGKIPRYSTTSQLTAPTAEKNTTNPASRRPRRPSSRPTRATRSATAVEET